MPQERKIIDEIFSILRKRKKAPIFKSRPEKNDDGVYCLKDSKRRSYRMSYRQNVKLNKNGKVGTTPIPLPKTAIEKNLLHADILKRGRKEIWSAKKAVAEKHPSRKKKKCFRLNDKTKGLLGVNHLYPEEDATPGEPPKTPHKREESLKRAVKVCLAERNYQLDFLKQTEERRSRVVKKEAMLLEKYTEFLGRKLKSLHPGKLRCDAFDDLRNNLIEAKSSRHREYIRMAVGQLLDYSFQCKEEFPTLHKAILVPNKPDADVVRWLDATNIAVIWPK